MMMTYSRLASLLVGAACLGSAACSKDQLVVQTTGSLGEQIVGEWALVRRSCGSAGTPEDFPLESSPDVIQFLRNRDYTRITPRDTFAGQYWMRDVERRGDTLEFRFGLNSEDLFGARRFFLISGEVLETAPENCEQVHLVYNRRR